MMHKQISIVKHQIWTKLAVFFNKYKGANGQMSKENVEQFIVHVLGEQTKQERDYVMNNFFRVDLDDNGTVSFFQLGTFLFAQHCRQISLQRHHKMGKMSYGPQREMTFSEFIYLINQAYKFLSVSVSEAQGRKLFDSVDGNKDNRITYEEYFKILHVNACTNELPPEIKVINSHERHSKLRKYIWDRLKLLFEAHIKGRNLMLNQEELRALISAIMADFSKQDIDFILSYMRMSESNIIRFEPLASRFIEVAARLGLKKFMKNHIETKRMMNKLEFVRLLKETFRFLDLSRFKDSILCRIFQKINKNNDGWITYDEYMEWVIKFLAIGLYKSGEFLAVEDDMDFDSTSPFEAEINFNQKRANMVFSDYSLAKMVRARVRQIIMMHARDEHSLFNRLDIEKVIKGITKENTQELKYVIAGVFREDQNDKGSVTLEEFVNFFIELYYGQLAIQRLHASDYYLHGQGRKMARSEFKKTIQLMLSYIRINPLEKLLDRLFDEIDVDGCGAISYRQYFTFNIFYFGKCSLAALNIFDLPTKFPRLSADQFFVFKLRHLSPYSRFKAIILNQIKEKFNLYGCKHVQTFEPARMRVIIQHTFKTNEFETEYLYRKFFNFMVERGPMITLDQIIQMFVAACFEMKLCQMQAKKHFNPETELLLDFQQFWESMITLSHFVPIKPLQQDLLFIFNDTDCDKDMHVSWHEFTDLARNIFVVRGLYNQYLSQTKSTINGHSYHYQNKFIEEISDTIRSVFESQDKNNSGMLGKQGTELCLKNLNIFTNKQVNYMMWNLFDSNLTSHAPQKHVNLHQFSSSVLGYIGQLSLQKFQAFQSTSTKTDLLTSQFYLIIHNAFSPLVEMPRHRDTVSKISRRLGKNDQLTCSRYLNWIHESFVMNFHQKMID